MSGDVRRAAKRLHDAIENIAVTIDAVPEWNRLNAYPALLRRLDSTPDGAKQSLAIVTGDLAARLHEIVRAEWGDRKGKPKLTIARVGTVEAVYAGGSTTWQGAALARRIAARAVDLVERFDPTTGAVRDEPLPPAVLAQFIAEELIACAGLDNASGAWRKEQLRDRGIEPRDYSRTSGDRRPTVKWA